MSLNKDVKGFWIFASSTQTLTVQVRSFKLMDEIKAVKIIQQKETEINKNLVLQSSVVYLFVGYSAR